MKHSSPIKYCKEYNVLNVSHECRKIHNLVAKSESLKCLGNLKVHLRHSSLQFIRYIVLCSIQSLEILPVLHGSSIIPLNPFSSLKLFVAFAQPTAQYTPCK